MLEIGLRERSVQLLLSTSRHWKSGDDSSILRVYSGSVAKSSVSELVLKSPSRPVVFVELGVGSYVGSSISSELRGVCLRCRISLILTEFDLTIPFSRWGEVGIYTENVKGKI